MTQTQTQQPQNNLAALDKKVADGIAADKMTVQPQQDQKTPDVQGAKQQGQAESQKQQGDTAPAAKS